MSTSPIHSQKKISQDHDNILPLFYPEIDFLTEVGKQYQLQDSSFQPIPKAVHPISDEFEAIRNETGEESWLIIHAEEKAETSSSFENRMLGHFSRLYEQYRTPFEAIAIEIDRNNIFLQPSSQALHKVHHHYSSYKVNVCPAQKLQGQVKPFSLIMLTCLEALGFVQRSNESFDRQQRRLFKELFKMGHDKRIIQHVSKLVKFYVGFPEGELEKRLA
ncbi:MAG: hypothetical protein AAFY71_18255 [Bacteroidota bacterium]